MTGNDEDKWQTAHMQSPVTGEYFGKALREPFDKEPETRPARFVYTGRHKTEMSMKAELSRNKELWEARNP
jgi:hypothetical protein